MEGEEQQGNLDVPIWNIFGDEEAGPVARINTVMPVISRMARAKNKKTKAGSSEPRSLWRKSLKKISWEQSVSFTFGILLPWLFAGVEGALASTPVNTLVRIGQTARMNCSTSLNRPVYWIRIVAGSDEQQWLYYGKNGFDGNYADDRFSIDKEEATGRFDIIIADVQPKDAGQYTCIDDSGLGALTSAELVISAHMNCNSFIPRAGVMGYNVFGIEQDYIHFSCNLNYSGNISPILKWSWPGYEVQSAERTVSDVIASSVASTLKLSPTTDHNNVKFQCKADLDGAKEVSVDNELTWESETVIVKYAVPTPNLMDVCLGVQWMLVCNPTCTYNFVSKYDECHCQYTYYDSRTQQKYQTASYPTVCGKENNTFRIVVIAIEVIVPVLYSVLVTFIIVCFFCTKRNRPDTKDKSEDQMLNTLTAKDELTRPKYHSNNRSGDGQCDEILAQQYADKHNMKRHLPSDREFHQHHPWDLWYRPTGVSSPDVSSPDCSSHGLQMKRSGMTDESANSRNGCGMRDTNFDTRNRKGMKDKNDNS